MQTQARITGGKVGGCDNIISFAEFVAHMTKREKHYAINRPATQDEGSVIYIGDLR